MLASNWLQLVLVAVYLKWSESYSTGHKFRAFALLSIATLIVIPRHHCSTDQHTSGDYTPQFEIQSFSVQLTAGCYRLVKLRRSRRRSQQSAV